MSTGDTSTERSRLRLGGAAATLLLVSILAAFMAASTTPTPLYRLYQEAWGFSPVILTVVFSAYAFSLLLALLTAGKLSDHIGRRPVIFAALALEILAMVAFIGANSANALIGARLCQGFATGVASGVLGAAILDASLEHGPLINGIGMPVGLAIGAVGASILAEFAPLPLRLSYMLLLALFALQALSIWLIPETGRPRPGAWASLVPSVGIPRQARRMFLMVTPLNVAAWAFGSFYFSLAPSVVREATGSVSHLLGGLVVGALTVSGAVGILILRFRQSTDILVIGASILAFGAALLVAATHLHSTALIFIGTMVAGFGWGGSFLGVLRTLTPLAAPEERAGLMAAYYVESYLTMSLPALLAGQAVRAFGLAWTTDIYAGAVICLALSALLVQKMKK